VPQLDEDLQTAHLLEEFADRLEARREQLSGEDHLLQQLMILISEVALTIADVMRHPDESD